MAILKFKEYTVTSSRKIFIGHTRQDSNNVIYTVREITSFDTKILFLLAEINTLSNGLINYLSTLSIGAADPDHFLSEASVVLDAKERLWVLDKGRLATPSGALTLFAKGGSKLVSIDLETNSIF